VREVHCWTNRPIWPQGMPRPTETMAVPDGLDWDLWIGPTPMRPFTRLSSVRLARRGRTSAPARWGDMACHVMDAAFRDLKLGRRPALIATRLQLPPPAPGQRGSASASTTTTAIRRHRSSTCRSRARRHAAGEAALVRRRPAAGAPDELEPERELPESGTIFVGDKGKMWCETYSESPRLIPSRR
jgi:hypothetical protein